MSSEIRQAVIADVVAASEETAAAIGAALATSEVSPALAVILRNLHRDLIDTLGDTAPSEDGLDEATVARVVVMRLAVGEVSPRTATETIGTSAGSWLRLARAFARRGARALAAEQAGTTNRWPAVIEAYLTEVAQLLLVVATRVEEDSEAEVHRLANLIP